MSNGLWKSVFLVGGGAVIAQAITFLFSLLVTRIYLPEIFGIVGVITSFVNIFIPIAGLSLPAAIVLPKEDKKAQSISTVSIIFSIAFSVFFLLGIVFYDTAILKGGLEGVYYLIAVGLFCSALLNVYKNWLLRFFLFRVKSLAVIFHSLLFNISKVLVGLISSGVWSLALVTVLGPLIQIFFINKYTSEKIVAFNRHMLKRKFFKGVFSKYSDFPKYRMPQLFLETLANSFPVVVLGFLYGAESAGYLVIANLALGAPVTVLAQAIQSVFFPSFNAEFKNKSNYFISLIRIIVIMILFSFLPFGMVFFYGEDIFSLVFGGNWVKSGEYAKWLAIYSFFLLLTRPIVSAMMVLSGQKILLIFEILGVLVKFFSLIVPFLYGQDALCSIKVYSILSSSFSVFLIGFCLIYTYKKYKESYEAFHV